jgi:hypothetical protein
VKTTELGRDRDAEEGAIGFGPRGAHSDHHRSVRKPSSSVGRPSSSRGACGQRTPVAVSLGRPST